MHARHHTFCGIYTGGKLLPLYSLPRLKMTIKLKTPAKQAAHLPCTAMMVLELQFSTFEGVSAYRGNEQLQLEFRTQ
jgi:hypothetical protein